MRKMTTYNMQKTPISRVMVTILVRFRVRVTLGLVLGLELGFRLRLGLV